MEAFCADVTAMQASLLCKLNRNTINRYYGIFREVIFDWQEEQRAEFFGVVEVDESYFGGKYRRSGQEAGKRGRGTDKSCVFGIFERGGRVYTEIIPDAKKKTLQQLIRGHVALDVIIVSDGWRGYNGLVDVGYDRHLRVHKTINGETRHVRNGIHINGIESFWSFTKRRLAKFNGVAKNFDLHLKECEWRWSKNFDILLHEIKKLLG